MNPSPVAIAGRVGVAAITLERQGDGVAYAGALLERAIASIVGENPSVLELSPSNSRGPTHVEEARFVLRLGMAQLRDAHSWWLFNHVGIARAQRLIPSFIRRPYAVLLCGIEVWDPALTADRKSTLRHASTRIAISELTAGRVRASHPDIGPIVACPLALLPKESITSATDAALVALVNDQSVLIVGRMSSSERYKGHDELLECWSEVLRVVPDAQLIVAGRGDDLERLQSKAGELGLQNHVVFTGFVSEETLEALRKRVAVFAMPSRGEGFGLVYLEAMRAGMPCIGGTDDAGPEVIVDGETGICVNPANKTALANAVILLLTTPSLRAAYAAAGRKRFLSSFTFERFCERLAPILRDAFP